nr:UDP-N-acetylglucosamine 2-epimerase (non-hydrolyzing) [Sphingorhabdus lutea]
MKIMLVFGTRPEAIKMAPLLHKLREYPEIFDVKCCVTAQHRQMLDNVLETFSITPDYDLDIMKAGQDLTDITSNVLTALRDLFKTERPDFILVHGDTSTTMAASMASFYAGIKIGHVEAGLRTHNLYAPFPEEFNRKMAGMVANLHFAPTQKSAQNLINEGVDSQKIFITGNSVIDALYFMTDKLDNDADFTVKIDHEINSQLGFDWQASQYILMTGHRRENFGVNFINICRAIKHLSVKYPSTQFIYPVHLNPNVIKPVNDILADCPNVHLIKPLNYEPFVRLLSKSHIILTDSGGIQEEAPSLGKPVLVMRDVTERPEAVDAGTVKLVGADYENIIRHVSMLLDDNAYYQSMSGAHNPYGDGTTAEQIVKILENHKAD